MTNVTFTPAMKRFTYWKRRWRRTQGQEAEEEFSVGGIGLDKEEVIQDSVREEM